MTVNRGQYVGGPSSPVRGAKRSRGRLSEVGKSARFAGTPGHGRRLSADELDDRVGKALSRDAKLGIAGAAATTGLIGAAASPPGRRLRREANAASLAYRASPEFRALDRKGRRAVAQQLAGTADVNKGFIPTSVLTRMKPIGEALQSGVAQGRGLPSVTPGGSAARTAAGKVGSIAGKATATPMRTATTVGGLTGMGTAATYSAMKPNSPTPSITNNVGKADDGPLDLPGNLTPAQRAQAMRAGRDLGRQHAATERAAARSSHGAAMASHRFNGPKPRHYDPDTGRQRRLGAGIAALGLAGAGLTARGAMGVRASTRLARGGVKFAPSQGRPMRLIEIPGKDGKVARHRLIEYKQGALEHAEDLHQRGIAASRTDLGYLAAGGASAAGAGALHRYSRDPRSRRWN